jgi:pimeloyl-ACP methyl ester carboxylesterase
MELAHDVVATNDGPWVVLIHGITEDRRSWAPLINPLASDRRVLAVDLRGHGESDVVGPYDPISYAQDVLDTMHSNGIDTADIIGHSLGGVVASGVAALGGARRVVNIDQPLRLAGFKDGLTQLEPLLRGDSASFLTGIDMVFNSMVGPLGDDEAARIATIRAAKQDVVLGTWQSVFDSTPEELDATVAQLAGAISVPYLAIHGIDPGPGYTEWLTSLVPTASMELWPDHGHYPHLLDPTRFLERITTFLE